MGSWEVSNLESVEGSWKVGKNGISSFGFEGGSIMAFMKFKEALRGSSERKTTPCHEFEVSNRLLLCKGLLVQRHFLRSGVHSCAAHPETSIIK